MALTVKAYLKRCENGDPEIRRFALEQDKTSDYEHLATKVAQVFPCLGRPEKFTLAWKDSDNDVITFSSDEELMEAVSSLQENVFRVYVKEKKKRQQGKGTAAGAEGEVFHPGVVCDGCEGCIRGPRFKCLICPDYDLCKGCEEKGLHPEHEFVKFRKPGIGRSNSGGFKWSPNVWRGFGHPGWRHWWWQQHRQGAQGQGQGPRGPHCWGPGQSAEGETSEPQQQQQQQQQQGGCGGANEEESRDFMKHIGEQVAELLDPLGIDVDIETSIGGMRRKCHKGGPRGGKGKGKCRGEGGGDHGKSGKGQEEKEDATANMETEKQNEETTKSAADSMETESGPSSKKDDVPSKKDDVPSKKDGACGSDDGGEWTMVTEGTDGDTPDDEAPPHITDALDQLRSMGFDDEGGWLTHLVEAKGGDLNRILDTIRLNP